ncbi:UbiA prenyltransferase family-domain-containing protein [Xylariaceae sp. FL0662B]|nr:UbiA prenyltransferase family-domain-containing protein [Xylariaceae sp. FL0662B]
MQRIPSYAIPPPAKSRPDPRLGEQTAANPSTIKALSRVTLAACFQIRTLWLFTYSDHKTILIPCTIFGLTNAFASVFHHDIAITGHSTYLSYLFRRSFLVLIWVWLNLLPLCINNQQSVLSIIEDTINKPWRPLPSGRLSPLHAKKIMIFFYGIAHSFSAFIGCGLRQSIGLVLFSAWYSGFGGGNDHPLLRNFINAAGYVCFTSGAMEAALGVPLSGHYQQAKWFGIIGGIITTTMHVQDMYDQEGDAGRGRHTMPLAIGDKPARWLIAFWMIAWGIFCPRFWGVASIVQILAVSVAALVAFRTVAFRDVANDKVTFVIWNCWVSLIFTLPAWQTLQI